MIPKATLFTLLVCTLTLGQSRPSAQTKHVPTIDERHQQTESDARRDGAQPCVVQPLYLG
jgi:hypothetical protein